MILLYAILCINNTTDNTTLNLRFKIAEDMQKKILQTSVPIKDNTPNRPKVWKYSTKILH